ncbi:MAG: DUF2871 domain-containing protein [Eubacteriales bacterium]|nr:DUF2871 domain-containing protein [Eubacteriales bacterium]
MKRYINGAITYAALATAGGVFYREFTKFNHFTGQTTLSVLHTHYFVLGMLFFLLLLLLEKSFAFSTAKSDKILLFYNIGLNTTVALLFVRGITQVLNMPLSSGQDAAISGIAGLGHIILAVSIIYILLEIKKAAVKK